MTKAKAIWATVLGFLAPGAGALIPQVAPGGDGIQSNELIWAALLCVVFGAGTGGAVYAVKNKPTQP
jgi:hypothetical protein